MKHQWDQPPHPNPNRSADAEVARDLDRHLARQDRADARAAEVERMAEDILDGTVEHPTLGGYSIYAVLVEEISEDQKACEAMQRLYNTESIKHVPGGEDLRDALQKAAHAYADENLEKLLEGGL